MSLHNTRALVYWNREKKTGIEPIKCVPESSRFVGAVCSVKHSGNKKFYPAKILMVSGKFPCTTVPQHSNVFF